MITSAAKSISHIGGANAATVLAVTERHRHLLPFADFRTEDLNRTAERIGVGNLHGAFAAVNLNRTMAVSVNVKTGNHRNDRAAFEFDNTGEVSGHGYGIFAKRLIFVLVGFRHIRT